ncbi:WD40/YVTN/BNR-like repeat-containing protein [Planococcus sp. YIM B11945]|uniref:WD40/YVTN/BNR-like repeat-containing protein n=1 Tax=Planococcus sp. YIM B11945 TaxID=3435410 RepID=UPI003D7ED3A1
MRKFFLGMADELLIVEETTEGFAASAHLQGTQPVHLAVDPQDEQVLYCAAYGNGLWKSEDGGRNWRAIGQPNRYHGSVKGHGISSPFLTFVAVHPNRKSVVYAGTEPSAVYCSEDGGVKWTEFKNIQLLPSKDTWQFPPRPFTHHVRWITPSLLNDNHLYVSIEFGAFIRTTDHGKTWQDRPLVSPLDTHTLLTHPEAPGRLYAAAGDGLLHKGHSYAESEDGGANWTYKSEGLEAHPYLYNMVLHPENPDDRLVSASKNAQQAHAYPQYSTVYRKTGDGPWKECAAGLPCEGSYSHELAADPKEPGVFYALNNQGLYQLRPEDSEWRKLDLEWKGKYDRQHPSFLVVLG